MFRILALLFLMTPGLTLAQQADRLPAYLLQVPASVVAIFVAETDTSTLHRFDTVTSVAGPRDERYISVGQNGVGKQKAWDRRTPLGIYFISEELDTSGLHERYGPLAFPLDYPNVWDRANQRGGDGIWIHGVAPDAGRRPPLDTDGCIALPNDALMEMREQFVPLVTPVIITRQIHWLMPEQVFARRDEITAILGRWAESYRSGDLYGYLSLYAEDFAYRGMTREEWASYRMHGFSGTRLSEFTLTEVLLLADPEDEGLYLSRFRQTIVDDERTITTIKRLYWRRTADGDLEIVAEDNG